jgi:putative transcriptional regulator
MGYKIKEKREELKMTQEELALKSGVSRGTICALESEEERNVTTTTLCKLAKALGTTVEQLFFAKSV